MKLQRSTVVFAICSCVVSSALSFGSSRSQSLESVEWGAAVTGIQMSLSAVESETGKPPELLVEIRNVGDHDVTLNLGRMLANGKVQLPSNISLNLTDAEGKTRTFKFSDKRHSFIAGRVDDFVVPLRAGSIYTLRLTLDQFWCQETSEFEVKLLPGRNQLVAQFEGGGAKHVNLDMPAIKLMNFWEGKVQSNTIAIDR